MSELGSPFSSGNSEPPKKPGSKVWWVLLGIVAVLIALLFLIPELFAIIAFVGLILGIVGLVKGRVPWLGMQGKGKAGGLTAAMVILMAITGAIMGPSETAATVASPPVSPIVTTSESPTPSPSESPSPTAIADFVGKECDGDELVMEQGTDKLFCDENASKVFVWATQDDHDMAILAAKKAEEKKAAEAKAAAEKKEADAKAAAEKKVAEKRAAEEKAYNEERKKSREETIEKIIEQGETEEHTKKQIIEEKTVAPAPANTFYANCSAVKAAGAAPIYSGDPGYSRKLDRDGDGVACEN